MVALSSDDYDDEPPRRYHRVEPGRPIGKPVPAGGGGGTWGGRGGLHHMLLRLLLLLLPGTAALATCVGWQATSVHAPLAPRRPEPAWLQGTAPCLWSTGGVRAPPARTTGGSQFTRCWEPVDSSQMGRCAWGGPVS